eukprot:TRINITY_DN1787_c0_g1_i2.p1 TRINITY_DN1787_c0_g1~~TRINITY_DN1787_c0_g1_i2.p1  ORF type:complete len:205 (+),score=68.92 TRINITY_DN1787_c0_g1_i2:949-1563(+)
MPTSLPPRILLPELIDIPFPPRDELEEPAHVFSASQQRSQMQVQSQSASKEAPSTEADENSLRHAAEAAAEYRALYKRLQAVRAGGALRIFSAFKRAELYRLLINNGVTPPTKATKGCLVERVVDRLASFRAPDSPKEEPPPKQPHKRPETCKYLHACSQPQPLVPMRCGVAAPFRQQQAQQLQQQSPQQQAVIFALVSGDTPF